MEGAVTAIQASGRIHPTKHLLCATHSLKFRESMILKKMRKPLFSFHLQSPRMRRTYVLMNMLDAEQ